METTIRLIRGDTRWLSLEITNNDEAVDITGYSFFFTVKRNLNDADADAILKKDWSLNIDPVNGLTEVELTTSDTNIEPGTYYYDIQMKTSDLKIVSTEHGILEVVQDITSRTS